MGVVRNLLLAGSENQWLRQHGTRIGFVRRAVRRFMPGETAQDAIGACAALSREGITSLWTHLGENVRDLAGAEAVAREYAELIAAVAAQGLDAHASVKPTHLGLDLGEDECYRHLLQLAGLAGQTNRYLWIDMEGSSYVDATLRLYRRLKSVHPRVGVCLQAYLRRTPADLESLLPLGPAIRLVKGAYREAPGIAFEGKQEVDAQYLRLAERLLGDEARAAGAFAGLATHDLRLIGKLRELVGKTHAPTSSFEFEMLFGIQREEQRRLAAAGVPVRVLVSYGEFWFPWFMRRLAERPANVWFVVRNLFG